MAESPSLEGSTDITSRAEMIQYIIDDKHGFFMTLVKGLYHGERFHGKGPSFESAMAPKRILGLKAAMLGLYDLGSFYGSQEGKPPDIGENSKVARAIAGMVKPVQIKAKIDSRRSIVAVGDGNFKDRNGRSVKSEQVHLESEDAGTYN
ncbi:hypothetical protein BGZ76_002832 [Entomortierella beljakovae]|nr:hypothetical protein BGZ76_002832 [Entomortierella beljakovae]